MISDDELSNIEARSDVYRLVAEVRRLRAENERLRGASAETTAPAPTFKVGDRVRYVGKDARVPRGGLGTVKRHVVSGWFRPHPLAVEFDAQFDAGHDCSTNGISRTMHGHGWWCGDFDLEPVEQTPAVAHPPLPTTPVVSHEQPVRDTQVPGAHTNNHIYVE